MSIYYLTGVENFRLGELVELGRRLTERQLEKMKLLEAVIQAEQEYLWRIRGIADLAREFSGQLSVEIEKELRLAENFAFDPNRKESYLIGKRLIIGKKRSLPEPGTLIVREYRYKRPWKEITSQDGSKHKVSLETFRFVVVDTPSTILRLGDKQNGIYISVSSAASAATGCQTDGWRFFEKF